jgi:hypothetical protein
MVAEEFFSNLLAQCRKQERSHNGGMRNQNRGHSRWAFLHELNPAYQHLHDGLLRERPSPALFFKDGRTIQVGFTHNCIQFARSIKPGHLNFQIRSAAGCAPHFNAGGPFS